MQGVWRAFMAKYESPDTFTMGEYRFEFHEATLDVTHPNKTKYAYDVATTAGDTFALTD
jgi:hypothetical protein